MSITDTIDPLQVSISTPSDSLLEKDSRYCSYGDTVHYADPPKIFQRCDGSYLFDERNTPYLDLQMWYSAVNFGYKNRRLNDALKQQIARDVKRAQKFFRNSPLNCRGGLGATERIVSASAQSGLDRAVLSRFCITRWLLTILFGS